MKTIYKIARAELRLLFYSPIAWLLLLCFVVLTGHQYTYVFDYLMYQMKEYGGVTGATRDLFFQQNGIWVYVQGFMYFYIPLLTMGMVSKEFSGGSIKLLYSSPVSTAQIILGKYLALVFYALVLMTVLVVYAVIGFSAIKNVEVGLVWTGFLGLFLLVCTYLAVGLFVSSLTSYQIIAAVGTFIVLFLLGMIGRFGQHYDFVREITYWLSLDGRTDTFMSGMICSEDLIYFPVVSGAFLLFSIIRLNAVRQKQRFAITCGKNFVVVACVVVVAYFSSRPMLTAYYDATTTKSNTLTPVSRDIVSRLDGGMTITSYVNVLDPAYWQYKYPNFIMENIRFFRNYVRFKPEIKLKTVYYYAEPDSGLRAQDPTGRLAWEKTKKLCEREDLDSTFLKTIRDVPDLSEEGYTFIRQIERENGQKTWLRVYNRGVSTQPTEAEVSVALKRMIMKLPKIGFVTGHEERGMEDRTPYGYQFVASNKKMQASVWNQGFDVEEVNLDGAISDDIHILIIADPRKAFTPEEEKVLKSYIDRGDHLFFLGEPRHREAVNPMLQRLFGVELTPTLVVDSNRGSLAADVLVCEPTKDGERNMRRLRSSGVLVMPTVAGVEVVEDKGYATFPVVQNDTTRACWTELETKDFFDTKPVFNPEVGEVSKVFATVLGLTRKVGDKEQRIMIAGDADCLANNEFTERRGVGGHNENLLLGGCAWMSYGEAPLDMYRPRSMDNKIYFSKESYSVIRWCIHWGLPLLILVCGLIVWLRRRRR